jgi:signal transduction histidine kinase
MADEMQIPLTRLAAFLRQHTHDVRNALNSLELETALLQELVRDAEGLACVDRIRSQVRTFGGQMRSLSALFQEPQPDAAPIAASELFLIWKDQQAGLKHPLEVEWQGSLGAEKVNVDTTMMSAVFRELLANAAAFGTGGKVTASAQREGGDVVFALREPKTAVLDTSRWGEPLVTTRRGGYGLGLWSAQRLLTANRARITQQQTPGDLALVTRISVPVLK